MAIFNSYVGFTRVYVSWMHGSLVAIMISTTEASCCCGSVWKYGGMGKIWEHDDQPVDGTARNNPSFIYDDLGLKLKTRVGQVQYEEFWSANHTKSTC